MSRHLHAEGMCIDWSKQDVQRINKAHVTPEDHGILSLATSMLETRCSIVTDGQCRTPLGGMQTSYGYAALTHKARLCLQVQPIAKWNPTMRPGP